VWHDFIPEPSTRWHELRTKETLEQLQHAGLAAAASAHDLTVIAETWSFPLHSVEVERKAVDIEDLRRKQAAWSSGL